MQIQEKNGKLEENYLNDEESNAGEAKRGRSCFSSKMNSKKEEGNSDTLTIEKRVPMQRRQNWFYV